MGKLAFITIFLLQFAFAAAQHTVRFIVTDARQRGSIYLAGDFDDWNPGNPAYQLTAINGTQKQIVLSNVKQGNHEYKFTCGKWASVEANDAGMDIDNRIIDVEQDTTVQIKIAGWLDDYINISKLPDSAKFNILFTKSHYYLENNIDSSYKYADEAIRLSNNVNMPHYKMASLNLMGSVMQRKGDNPKALEFFFRQLEEATQAKDTIVLMLAYNSLGNLFKDEKDYDKAKGYYLSLLDLLSYGNDYGFNLKAQAFINIGQMFFDNNKLDSALKYTLDAYHNAGSNSSTAALLLGDIEMKMANDNYALNYYHEAVSSSATFNNYNDLANAFERIAEHFKKTNQPDSAFNYAKKAFMLARQVKTPLAIANAGALLVDFFESKHQLDSAFIYQKIVLQARASLFDEEKTKQVQKLVFDRQMHQQEILQQRVQYTNRLKIYGLSGGVGALLLVAFILLRNNRHKQKANALLVQKQAEVQNALNELKAAQSQLIQSEKMASLGELTAGIAHEIQNPLNFVNNFSEVSRELLDEMNEELLKGNYNEAKLIAEDLQQNLEKINTHGQRAGSIVKGMLQHSRKSTGIKELVDINTLADEYARLTYNGLRAKNKSFNATIRTSLDENAGKLNIIPQDIGRVLLNLLNNAFYAVNEKKQLQPEGYEPTVWLTTKKLPTGVEITIKDNGTGMPQELVKKIFQPFFTTKPTGQGTGLGLSLSYDIIKTHGGTITVHTKQGEGTAFVIVLNG